MTNSQAIRKAERITTVAKALIVMGFDENKSIGDVVTFISDIKKAMRVLALIEGYGYTLHDCLNTFHLAEQIKTIKDLEAE